jgi:hypothetical protein
MTNKEIVEYQEYEATFIKLKTWFDSRMEQLEMIADANEDQELVFETDEGERVEISGEKREGLIAGVKLCLEVIGEFPLTITTE